ncbi:MAG: tetratricopeptide repeat protein [Candidatus Omnitrophica bacterium]|nr:tetratricopeptide repeat protein [Candidatus Omnitrophota bacterium]
MSKQILAKSIGFGLVVFAVIFSAHSVWAQRAETPTAKQLFEQGNAAYKEGKYEAAIGHYENVIRLNLENGDLYYNLGNSYFKKGELGKAVLSYEKALFFIPGDSDLRSNYAYVLSLLNLGPQPFGNWAERFANRLFEDATINFLTVFLFVIYFLTVAILMCYLFFASFRRSIRILFFVFTIVFILSAISLNSKITYLTKGAIVLVKEADVKFEPAESATTYFKLTEGSKVEIAEKAENWYKIKRPDGKIGWVSKKDLGLILNLSE